MGSCIPADLLDLLRCIDCRSVLDPQEDGFRCSGCGKTFPSVRGILRFVDADNYADSFGYQWHAFARTQLLPDDAEKDFRRKTGLTPDDVRGKLVLDVGCGMGRFAEVATRWGARVVGIDLSVAAEVAARNLADRDFVAFQADALALPFALESFDCIYSIGVLHHTPDCEKAFKSLPQYLKPGGSLAVWLYSGYNNWYRFSDQYRKVTHRVPVRTLHRFLRIAVPFFYTLDRGLRAIPVVGRWMAGIIHHFFPVNLCPDPEDRLLDTLDWYSPKYQSKHTYEQVFRWYENCAFEKVTIGDVPISIKGYKSGASLAESPKAHPGWRNTSGDLRQEAFYEQASVSLGSVKQLPLRTKLSRTMRWFPAYLWQRVSRPNPSGKVHLVISIANHFEPAIVPEDGSARAPYDEQERRLERWCREYPRFFRNCRDADGRPFAHTYFYPAEQYDRGLLQQLSHYCEMGWGEIEVHLHHGVKVPDTEENTRRQLVEFRDLLAFEHRSLSYLDGVGSPRYAFVHGNFALANTEGGRFCGVDSEMQVLAETGCYADLTFPPGAFYQSHLAKINSLYECSQPLSRRGAHRAGHDLECGRAPQVFPLMVEGPLMMSLARPGRRLLSYEDGSISAKNPPSMDRLKLWKQAMITVKGRPDWLFIKLQCHGMDPRDRDIMLGPQILDFVHDLVDEADQRSETIHFVTAREMVNIVLAACDGREGNPGEYRDYRLKRRRATVAESADTDIAAMASKS